MRKYTLLFIAICILLLVTSLIYSNYSTGLIDSAKAGNTNRLEKQIKSNRSELVLQKALNSAIIYNHKGAVNVILKYIKTVNYTMNNSDTPLITAASGSDSEIVKLLIEKGARVNDSNSEIDTPLYTSLRNNKVDNAMVLLENGANPNIGVKYLSENMQSKYKKKIIKVLMEKGINIKEDYASFLLSYAVESKNFKLIDLLLGKSKGDQIGIIAQNIVLNNDVEMLNYLVEKGLDIKSTSGCGEGLLSDSISFCKKKVFNYLIAKGVCLENDNASPLGVAVNVGDVEAAKFLLERGIKINRFDDPPVILHQLVCIALDNCDPEMVRLLIKYGAKTKFKGVDENFLIDRARDLKKNNVDWYDFKHKKDLDEIIDILKKAK